MSEATTLSSRISSLQAGQRLIDFLCARFKYHNRAEWEGLIRKGKVTVNLAQTLPERILNKNDIVSYTVILREPPVDKNIRIIHEEDAFLVADKPGNLPSHADGNFIKNTFIFILREFLAGRGYRGQVKLVHRLDRETSGIIIVAKSYEALRALVEQFEQGSVEKEYLAVAKGVIARSALEVGDAIAQDPHSSISIRKRVVPFGTPGASPALTRFDVIERLASSTLVRCMPLTGRTNQIRIHLDHIGHPLVGDKLYGRSDDEFLIFVKRARAGIYDPLPFMETPRHLLHAARLSFAHPVTGERLTFESQMPEDMNQYLAGHRHG